MSESARPPRPVWFDQLRPLSIEDAALLQAVLDEVERAKREAKRGDDRD